MTLHISDNCNLGLVSPFSRYSQFFVEKRTFFLPPPFNPKFENVFLACTRSLKLCKPMLIIRVKIPPKTYQGYQSASCKEATSVTGRRWTTDDNRTISSTVSRYVGYMIVEAL